MREKVVRSKKKRLKRVDLFIAELEGCGGNAAIEKQRHGERELTR